jgi:hypothetical protein
MVMGPDVEKYNEDKDTVSIESKIDCAVIGYVTYDVIVICPHCNRKLELNEHPYNDDETDYCKTEDELGLAVFGKTNDPAHWSGLDIEYKCCCCKELFYLKSLET